MSYNVLLENLIHDLGGCGRYQWIVAIIGSAAKCIVTWSMLAMTFNGQEPAFQCRDSSSDGTNTTVIGYTRACETGNFTSCGGYTFSDQMKTVVDEWELVCDRKWRVAMITSIQMAGVLVGCFVSGHLGDLLGRKPTFFLSLLILVVFNIVAYFSVNWQMYAAIRFILGMGMGFFLTVQYNITTEFVLTRWRPHVVAVPAWSLEAGLFALAAWGLKDWKNLHLATAAIGAPFLLTYCIVQESARWLVTKKRYEDADHVIQRIANVNGKHSPDTSKIMTEASSADAEKSTNYSVIDIFKSRDMTQTTLCMLFIWMTISYSYYGLTFGIASLAGDLYMNMFLMNIIEVPVSFTIMYILNKFGRKRCCMFSFLFTGLCGLIVGVVQYVDTPHRGAVTNAFALASKMGISVGWGCLIVFTTELYPTVVRTIVYGLHNTSARIGGMIAPQIVFLNDGIPGLMYFLSAAMMTISGLLCFMFSDTKDKVLEDTFKTNIKEDKIETTLKIERGNKDNVTGNGEHTF